MKRRSFLKPVIAAVCGVLGITVKPDPSQADLAKWTQHTMDHWYDEESESKHRPLSATGQQDDDPFGCEEYYLFIPPISRHTMTIEQTTEKVKERAAKELELRPKLHGSLCFHFKDGQLMKSRSHHFDEQLTVENTEKE